MKVGQKVRIKVTGEEGVILTIEDAKYGIGVRIGTCTAHYREGDLEVVEGLTADDNEELVEIPIKLYNWCIDSHRWITDTGQRVMVNKSDIPEVIRKFLKHFYHSDKQPDEVIRLFQEAYESGRESASRIDDIIQRCHTQVRHERDDLKDKLSELLSRHDKLVTKYEHRLKEIKDLKAENERLKDELSVTEHMNKLHKKDWDTLYRALGRPEKTNVLDYVRALRELEIQIAINLLKRERDRGAK